MIKRILERLNPSAGKRNLNESSDGGPDSESLERLGPLVDIAGAGTAPIASVSVGSTGLNRAKLYHKRMKAMDCAHRIQSMLFYDCNLLNIRNLQQEAGDEGFSNKMIIPEYLPFSEGFLRRVDQYERHYGAIERDMERMVAGMELLSLEAGTEPQIILEWIGFGGHAMLSYMLHDIVEKRFPEASILPILCFPDDQGMQQNIREHGIWDRTEQMGSVATLLTDNRRGTDYRRLDESLVTALAVVEKCFKHQNSSGSLAEVVSVFNITGNRWLIVENAEIPILLNRANPDARSKKDGMQFDENQKKALGKVAQKIKDQIWEIAHPENSCQKSAFFTPGTRNNEQRIYVTMPLYNDYVKAIQEDVEDQLKREEFSKAYPGTQISYAGGNPQMPTLEDREYVYVAKFVGLAAEPRPLSLTSILDEEPLPDDALQRRHRSVKTRGQEIIESDESTARTTDAAEPAGDDAGAGGRQRRRVPADNANAGADASRPAAVNADAGADVAKPAADDANASADAPEPAADDADAGAQAAEPATDDADAGAQAAEPAADHANAGAHVAQPAVDAANAGAQAAEPAADHANAGAAVANDEPSGRSDSEAADSDAASGDAAEDGPTAAGSQAAS